MWLVMLLLVGPLAALADDHPDFGSTDVGNWTVKDCILAQFALELQFDPRNFTDLNETETIKVPRRAKVNLDHSTCGKEIQIMSLEWTDKSLNETELRRNFTIYFQKQNATDKIVGSYGVQRIYGDFELAHFNYTEVKNKTNVTVPATSYVRIDSGERTLDKLMFRVPLNRSYLCHDIGQTSLITVLHYTGFDFPGTVMQNTTVKAVNVAFDAFRPVNAPKKTYQTPMDCDYEPNDIVPIAVGIALAGLVVFVLIAYMVGRRRRRQLGYQSV